MSGSLPAVALLGLCVLHRSPWLHMPRELASYQRAFLAMYLAYPVEAGLLTGLAFAATRLARPRHAGALPRPRVTGLLMAAAVGAVCAVAVSEIIVAEVRVDTAQLSRLWSVLWWWFIRAVYVFVPASLGLFILLGFPSLLLRRVMGNWRVRTGWLVAWAVAAAALGSVVMVFWVFEYLDHMGSEDFRGPGLLVLIPGTYFIWGAGLVSSRLALRAGVRGFQHDASTFRVSGR